MRHTIRFISMLTIAAALAACGDEPVEPEVSSPVLDSITPARGTVGTELRIHGSGFAADSLDFYLGETAVSAVERQDGGTFALAPEGLTSGQTYDLRIVNPDGGTDTLAGAFQAVPPAMTRINGVTKPSGLKGMTVIVDGEAFSDRARYGTVYFSDADGNPIDATIADSTADWTDEFVVTQVPDAIGDTSYIWLETPTGVSDSIEFQLIGAATFSPSTIKWTRTEDLPQPLQGLGAVFVPVESGDSPANYVFTVGGADSTDTPTAAVYRARVNDSGALDVWNTSQTSLPEPRAYHTTAGATAYTAALDTATTAAYLYALGGVDTTGTAVSTVYYAPVDPSGSVGTWATTTELPQPLHSASAAIFRGYMYLVGGIGPDTTAVSAAHRAKVHADGTLGSWEETTAVPEPLAYTSLVSFGPYLYTIGGETGYSPPVQATTTGTETAKSHLARVNLRTGELSSEWSAVSAINKARSKHSTIFGGGALFATSGVYSGQAGSSENIYSLVNSDGTLDGWSGATGDNTILSLLGYSLYNQAAVTFVDASGTGHVLVIGGAKRESEGEASAAVVYY